MQNMPEILKIIEAGLKNDSSKILNYSMLLAKKIENDGDKKNAERIISVMKRIKNIEMSPKNSSFLTKSPVDSESRLPLAEFEHYEEGDVFLSLTDNVKEDIEEYIHLIENSDNLLNEDVQTHRSLLFYGSPGTGKSQAAKYIAEKAHLPLLTVRIDGLVSSFLGNTSKNIRNLFDYVEKTPCILFLDEFDAIAKMRDDTNELGELKRVVNTLLQNIDSIKSKVSIIAATNHEHLLDSAVWRRFDYKIFLNLPDEKQRMELINNFLKKHELNRNLIYILVSMTNKMSGAEIEILMDMFKTNIILNKIENLNEKLILDIYIKYLNRSHRTRDENEKNKIAVIKSLRELNPTVFDYRTVGKLLGVPKSTAYEQLNKEVIVNG